MPRKDRDQVVGRDGSILEEVVVDRPAPVISDTQLQQAKQVLKTFYQTFPQDGSPNAMPSAAQIRSAILALIVVDRHLLREMDDET